MAKSYKNPYTPGAAHPPPYLAGRNRERDEFRRLLRQDVVLKNVVLTGVRGVGKTSLLREFFKPDAIKSGWLWAENDISENVAVGEDKMLTRIFADLGLITGDWIVRRNEMPRIGFNAKPDVTELRADAVFWQNVADNAAGLNSDKLKAVLGLAWRMMQRYAPKKRGIVFAYDEAQNFSDNTPRGQYPLSLLLDVFSSLQRQKIPFMLALTGLPPLHGKLVDSRTFAERMFRVIMLQNLDRQSAADAVLKPLSQDAKNVRDYFGGIHEALYDITSGYPYFIQYWCSRLYDDYHAAPAQSESILVRIRRHLDEDFYAGRWAGLSDRQRDLLLAAAEAAADGEEFTANDVVQHSSQFSKPFSASHVNQMLSALAQKGMVFKTRHGKYMFAVPKLDDYIRRQHSA